MWPLMGPYLGPLVAVKPMQKKFCWHGFPSNAPAVNFLSAISKGIRIFPFSQVQKDFIVTQNVKKDWIIYNCFLNRQSGKDNNRNFLLLVWDEWASYILSLDKKVAEEEKKKLAILLMLGRSFNVHVLLCMQRLDVAYIQSRDCINLVMAMGNLSEEGKEMMFHDYKKQMEPNRRQGTGYLTINGTNFTPFVVPQVRNHELLNEYIQKAVQR